MDLSSLRKEYVGSKLSYDNLLDNPILQFEKWFKEAQKSSVVESNAMTIATVDEYNIPNVRTVLLKYFDEKGFVFFTNYTSQKSMEIEMNPTVALLFPWLLMQRQVKVIGKAEKVSKSESLKYFLSRPKNSQLGAWVSQQSKVISSRKILLDKFFELKTKFNNSEIPFPDFWGGYRIVPSKIEFWQGGEYRLHDRFLYTKEDNNKWSTTIISP